MAQQIMASFVSLESRFEAEARLRAEGFSFVRQPAARELPDLTAEILPAVGTPAQDASWSLIVDAPFGGARRAIQILQASGAVALSEQATPLPARRRASRDAEEDVSLWSPADLPDQSFFVSSTLGLPLLINCPAPLSSILGLPTLIPKD